MSRPKIILSRWALCLTALVLPTLACTQNATQPGRARGIILISIDTLRADHLGSYGYERETSPHLDSLAEAGTVFEHAFAPIHGTLPSHMTMLTGLQPWNHGVYPPGGVLPQSTPLLQELLQEAGWQTGGITDGGYVDGSYGFSRGFDTFDDEAKKIETDIERTLAKGRRFIEQADRERPFFLFLHSYTVHDPYFPSGDFAANFPDEVLPKGDYNSLFGPLISDDTPFPTGPALAEYNNGRMTLDQQQIDAYRAAYDRSIRYVDDQLELFFQFLEDQGLSEETLVLITSDHGEEFGEHGRLAHTQIYREVLHVPMIIVGPGIDRERVATPVGVVDVTPTLLAAAGVTAPTNLDGTDVLQLDAQSASRPIPSEQLDQTKRSAVEGSDAEVLQLIEASISTKDWHAEKATFRSGSDDFSLQLRAFHEPRNITITSAAGTLLGEHLVEPSRWTSVRVQVPDPSQLPISVTVQADGCVSPADLGTSSDRRCLGFQMRGVEQWTSELYELISDPNSRRDLSVERNAQALSMRSALRWKRFVAPPTDLDPELEERLRALGYLQ